MPGPLLVSLMPAAFRVTAGTASIPAAASRSVAAFTPPAVPRTFDDRTGSILNSLEGLSERRGPLAFHYDSMMRDSKADERPFYAEASWHLDRLLQLEPWQDGENTYFEFLAYQILEAVLKNRDLASFVFFLSVMGGGRGETRSVAALEELALSENMRVAFGLSGRAPAPSTETFGYARAAGIIQSHRAFRAVRSEILGFLGTVVAKMEGKAPAAGLGSDVYSTDAFEFVQAFGYGLEHPEFSRRTEEAIRTSAVQPLGFLRMSRLAHVLMSREMEHKVEEFRPRGRDRLSEICAQIEEALRQDPESARARRPVSNQWKDWVSSSPIREARLLAEALGKTVSVSVQEETAFRKIMKDAYRHAPDGVDSHYRFPSGPRGCAEILLKSDLSYEMACRALHEWVHIGQARNHPTGWIEQHLALAEREAYALEVVFRLSFGDRRLYDVISSLSPQGFEAGLTILVEQLFFRFRELPT
ncbi:MAG TPA: hypothetical protein VLJ37_00400 [bacterium]|nr:hypothetical protein [bacterium]